MSQLIVSPGPHIKEKPQRSMQDVLIALIPAFFGAVIFFGIKALIVIIVTTLSAVVFEIIMLKIRKLPVLMVDVSSAALTGVLLAFCVSSAMPWWMMIIGSFVAIAVAKHAFGGLGYNIFNPALIGRAFLLASWPVIMTTWIKPFSALTMATPLNLLKEHAISTPYLPLIIGDRAGSIGETSVILLLIGAVYLFWKRTIDWRIPLFYFLTAGLFSFAAGQDVLFHLLSGGLILGAFYMATDPVTSPMTKPGRIIFGIGCGLITMVIRLWGGYPEGVCYAILLMNAVTPLLDRYLQGRIYGRKGWNTL